MSLHYLRICLGIRSLGVSHGWFVFLVLCKCVCLCCLFVGACLMACSLVVVIVVRVAIVDGVVAMVAMIVFR